MAAGQRWRAWRSCFRTYLPEISDSFLCNAILEVGIDPIEGELLSFGTAAVVEGVVCKTSIVAVVVEDADAVLFGKVLEGSLGIHGFLGAEFRHQMDVLEPGVVVHEDGGCCVALLGECPHPCGFLLFLVSFP
jgi:hypothetical protein